MAISTLLKGLGLGAGLMYFADPNSGRRRRARALDQWDRAVHCTQDFLDKAQRDAANRAAGLTAQATSLLHRDTADDSIVTARVRSKLGRYTSQPRAIAVETHQGQVTLSGSVPEHEVGDLLRAICSVSGVRGVENRLDVRQQPEDPLSDPRDAQLLGNHDRGFWESPWNPATRVAGQVAGAALMGKCLTDNRLVTKLLGTVGLGLFIRATTNRSFGQLLGTAEQPQWMRFQRTVTIHSPIEKVWDFLSDFEEVGRFLPGVTMVQDLGDGCFRWGLELPGGQELELEERLTEFVPQERLSWESASAQSLCYQGTLSVQSADADTTRIHLCFDYAPPGGALGAAIAAMFAADPKSLFQQAVLRIKPFLETGNVPHDLRELRRSQPRQSSPSLSGNQQPLESAPWTGPSQWVQGQPEAANTLEHPHLVHGQPELANELEHPQRVHGLPAGSAETLPSSEGEPPGAVAHEQPHPQEQPHSALSADQIPPAVHAEVDPNHPQRGQLG